MDRPPSTPAPPAPAPPDLLRLAGSKLGNYRLERLLGRGRMGVVYLAKDEALLRPTAVKVLAWNLAEARGQDPVEWFLREARLVARINDPRVVQVYGAARAGDLWYIAMEYVDGTSAEARVAGGARLPAEEATSILLQAASALHAAHRAGVVHRDIKPANLLLDASGVTKLGDFGMAFGGAHLGSAQARVGTPLYTAPEVWRGAGSSAASDVYALGATYFHLLTGRPPFDEREVAEVERAHFQRPPPDPRSLVPGLPDSCAALVARALAKGPAGRQPSAQALAWDARRVLQDLVAANHASSPSLPRAPRPRPERRAAPRTALPPASGPLAALGFRHRPFAEVDPAACPYQGVPHAALRLRLLALADEEEQRLAAVTGPPGSGRSVLCRSVATELTAERLVLYLDVLAEPGRTLVQRLCRAATLPEGGPEEVEPLVAHLARERDLGRPLPLVVLDGVRPEEPSAAGLPAVVAAARWSRAFRLLMTGAPDLAEALARAGVERGEEPLLEIPIPPLDREQVAAYVQAWLGAARAPGAPPVLFGPDALLLLARRSGGLPGRVNLLCENVLLLLAAAGQRTATSWHAWAASDRERWAASRPPAALLRPPAGWPSPEALAVLDACRRAAGLPPWPRAAGAGPSASSSARLGREEPR